MTLTADSTPTTQLDRWTPTTVNFAHQPPATLPGEPAPTAGLVIVPELDTVARRYTGLWSVIHTGTGYHVGPRAVPLVYAREAARLLADTGVDWTAPQHVLTDPARRLARTVGEIRTRVEIAWDDGEPTWWGRDSWTHARPAWTVRFADGGTHRADTWTSLASWLTEYDTTLRAFDGDPLYGGITDIVREPAATWRMTCAAPLCDNDIERPGHPMVLADDGDEDGGTGHEIRYPDRGDTMEAAHAAGWTRHDRTHWTCPVCTALHTVAIDAFRLC